MRQVRRTGQKCAPRAFRVEDHLEYSFGVTEGDPVEIRLRFRGRTAQLVSERIWHHSQQITSIDPTTVEVTFYVAKTPEVDRWVGWGGGCQVLGPDTLRTDVRQAALAILAQYDS